VINCYVRLIAVPAPSYLCKSGGSVDGGLGALVGGGGHRLPSGNSVVLSLMDGANGVCYHVCGGCDD